MQKLDKIAEELFNKIRGRYPKVTLGTEVGEITSDPGMARFFEFNYRNLGKVSVSLEEKNGIVVMYSKKLTDDTENKTQFFEFLRELRMFAKKRMLNFDTRDLTKSNLKKRDYQHLATTRPEEGTMTESKLYGTSRVSYQDVGSARLVVKHSQAVNPELAASRTQNIQSMYIESAEGERFKYPYRHLNGARAMARHVAEGGNAYDDFGKHIVGLSEELSKLRKFKNYMNRSSVMAEGLSGYMDAVHERIDTVKDRITKLQRESFYKEAVDGFETPVFEDVPDEVRENWIDQLTIRQFNEELADVFPYIYKLVSETTLAEEIGPEDLLGEERDDERIAKELMQKGYDSDNSDEELQNAMIELGYGKYMTRDRDLIGDVLDRLHDMTHGEDDGQPSSYDEYQDLPYGGDDDFGGYDEAIESSIEELMGQFGEEDKKAESPMVTATIPNNTSDTAARLQRLAKENGVEYARQGRTVTLTGPRMNVRQIFFKMAYDPGNHPEMVPVTKGLDHDIKIGEQTFDEARNTEGDRVTTDENPLVTNYDDEFTPGKPGIAGHMNLKTWMSIHAISAEYQEKLANAVVSAGRGKQIKIPDKMKADYDAERDEAGLKPRALWIELSMHHEEEKESDASENDMSDSKEKPQLPLSEKILSYFDHTTGQFPKGETAVLTMVEKDYGEEYIEPAKQFIEAINNKVAEMYGYKDTDMQEENYKLNDADKKVMQKLTGMIKQKQKEMQDARKGGYDEDVRMIASQLEDFYSIAELIQGKRPMGLDTSVMDLVHDMYDEVGAKFEGTELDRIKGLAGL